MAEFGKIVIFGTGLIGGSFALALKEAGAVEEVVGFGRTPATLKLAQELGVIDRAGINPAHEVGDADLVLVAVLAGMGNAPFHPADFTILNQRVSPQRLGHAFSVHGLTGNLGWALAPTFLVGITTLTDWRTAYHAAALLYLGVLALLFWQRDKLRTERVARNAGAARGSDLAFLKLPVVWWCFGFFLLSTMTLAVVQGFAPSILKAMHGVSMEAATLTISAYMLCGAVGMLAGGFLVATSLPSDRVVALAMAAGAAILLLCATGWLGAAGTMLALAATGFAIGVGGPSRDMMIRNAAPQGATGRVYGTVYAGLDVGFAVAPLIFGVFMDRGWYAATLAGAALVLLVSALAATGVGRRTAHISSPKVPSAA